MNVWRPDTLRDLVVVEPDVHGDERGFFLETWREARYRRAGIPGGFVQDNHSRSLNGVLRGLHFQHPHGQGKLVRVSRGSVFDVAVDVRVDSPTFGRWNGLELDDVDHRQVWIPPGFAHGFVVLSHAADFHYRCTESYAPESEHVLRWDDPDVGVAWPVAEPHLSVRDAHGDSLAVLRASGSLPTHPS